MAKAQVHLLPAARNTVMVVDDQSTSRAILEQVVRSLDDRVVVEGFARPVDAVVWAARHVADLVLVDFMMPDMDGIELVGRLRSLPGYEHVPIVMITGQDDKKLRYAALDAGITDFLTKPVDSRQCLAREKETLLRLDEVEWGTMQGHPVIGHEILKGSASKYVRMGALIALGHHERYNGKGYPSGLDGDHIPLCARIVAVAEVFDALTSVRSYKKAWKSADALDYIRA